MDVSSGTDLKTHKSNKTLTIGKAARTLKLAVLGSIILVAANIANSALLADQQLAMKAELAGIANDYRRGYGPLDWKTQNQNVNLDLDLSTALDEIDAAAKLNGSAASMLASRQAFLKFIGGFKDYHVSAQFYATEAASLPIVVKTLEGHTVIMGVGRGSLAKTAFPYDIGDEIVAVDGEPVSSVLKRLLPAVTNHATTDQAIADFSLFSRRAAKAQVVPKGSVVISVVKKGETDVNDVELFWNYKPERFDPRNLSAQGDKGLRQHDNEATSPYPDITRLMNENFNYSTLALPATQMKGGDFKVVNADGGVYGLGEKKSYIPPLGEIVYKFPDTEKFEAYIYKTAKGNVGVVRIPQYEPDDSESDSENYDTYTASFGVIINKMNAENVQALVIDQLNNPGGSVLYLYGLASMLVRGQAIATAKHRMILDSTTVVRANAMQSVLPSITSEASASFALPRIIGQAGYPYSLNLVRGFLNWANFTVEERRAGKRLSDPMFIVGVDRINKSTVADFVKPIVILTNELDFSGGDFFPAMLQDAGRAVVVGAQTSGAGGYVKDVPTPNSEFGLQAYRMTESIADRSNKDNTKIENNGVTPDVEVKMTYFDLQNQFQSYIGRVNQIVQDQITVITPPPVMAVLH